MFINKSGHTLLSASVDFALKSGSTLRGTAMAFYSGRIPPGASWTFDALYSSGGDALTHIDTGVITYTVTVNGVYTSVSIPIQFDPLFSPDNRRAQKECEKIHGKRKR